MSQNNLERRLSEVGLEQFEEEVKRGRIPSLTPHSHADQPEQFEEDEAEELEEEDEAPETKR